MKNFILFNLLLFCYISCNNRINNNNFERSFNDAIKYVSYYENYIGELNYQMKCEFEYSVIYLSSITCHNNNFHLADGIPTYTPGLWHEDSLFFINWYKKNKYKISDIYSDSISKISIDKIMRRYEGVEFVWNRKPKK